MDDLGTHISNREVVTPPCMVLWGIVNHRLTEWLSLDGDYKVWNGLIWLSLWPQSNLLDYSNFQMVFTNGHHSTAISKWQFQVSKSVCGNNRTKGKYKACNI